MNTTIKVLNYIANEKYGAKSFFDATDVVQDLVLEDYNMDKRAWIEEVGV
tara:strand:- start:196 stop:345 length:150 start_codon:yes stop_codon:yes gene_type:complete